MFTITAGCFNQPCDLQEQIGKSIVIADYASPDEAGSIQQKEQVKQWRLGGFGLSMPKKMGRLE